MVSIYELAANNQEVPGCFQAPNLNMNHNSVVNHIISGSSLCWSLFIIHDSVIKKTPFPLPCRLYYSLGFRGFEDTWLTTNSTVPLWKFLHWGRQVSWHRTQMCTSQQKQLCLVCPTWKRPIPTSGLAS